ncbi:hypothetical protein KIK84_09420 [Curvibacter sp. CHRR-16]|nr:hypothetical protein [Curvibacter sp. CHRR-16]
MGVLLVAVLAVVSAVVMLLWNWLMPAVFAGVKPIDYWQAMGLFVLSKLLLGGGGLRGKMRQRWQGMTNDERELFKRRFQSRWGGQFGSSEAAPHGMK